MAQSSLPQAGNKNTNPTYVDAGPYTADQWSNLYRVLFTGSQQSTQGVLRSVDNELAVTNPAGLQIVTATGAGIVNGRAFINTAAVTITVDGGANRSDALCIVENNTNAAIPAGAATNYNTEGDVSIPPFSARLAVVKNVTANFSQTGARYMTRLATFTTGGAAISNLTDARNYCEFSTQVSTENLEDLAVTDDKIAADSVDDTKVGDRVPQFYRRQGGSATNWATSGVTTYAPTSVRMQGGSAQTGAGGAVIVTFPVAFSNYPLVSATAFEATGACITATISVLSATTVEISCHNASGANAPSGTYVFWFAIGPE